MWATGGIARTMVAFAACCAASATAATVTVNAPAGTSTNVTQVFSGATTVAVNTGATGGTVRLSPHSTHTGGTTLASGTLDVQQESQLGGSLKLLGGNFRYSGPAGAVWTTAITNAAPKATVSQNWRIDSDLTLAGDMWSTDGIFVKTGSGTLTLAAPFYLGAQSENIGSRGTLINLSDAAAPTKGLSGATIAEGTVVVNTPYDEAVTNKLSNNAGASMIAARTTNAVNEAALIVSNGITRTHAALVVGGGYGKGAAGGSYVKGRLEVSGGTFIVGNTGANILYTCVNDIPNDLRVEAVVDVSSEQQLRCKGYCPAYNKNTYSLTYVHDGGFFYNQDGSIVAGNTGTAPADASTTNDVVITGSGTHLICQNFENDRQNAGMTTNLRLADGGELEMRNFVNSANGKFNVVFDGGVWQHRNHNNATPHFPSSMTSMKIGPGGLIVRYNGGSELYPVLWDKGLEPLDDSGTDGGLSVSLGSAAVPLVIRAANTYCGPTYISAGRVYLGGEGRLPSGTALTVTTSNGGLLVTNGVQTVGSFTFGTEGTPYSPKLGFDKESRLDVTGDVTVGILNEPQLHLFETRGMTNYVINGLSTLGTYTFVTASAASIDALQVMAKKFTFPYKPEGVEYECYAAVEDGRAKLKVVVTAAHGTATADGATLVLPSTTENPLAPTAEQLAAATTILANPQPCDTGSGTVNLGALGGFAAGGRLVAGSGTTRVSDLSFVQSVGDLVLTTGSLVYDGPSASIPGFTVDGNSVRSAVLNVANPDATLAISAVNDVYGALTKMGEGTLHFGGTGYFLWRREHHDFSGTEEAGVAPNGDGPAYGFRAFNVNEGTVTIGTLGDPTDAPTVDVPYELSVGSRSHQAGQGVQTAGSLTLNNGILAVTNTLLISYYSGNPDDQPDTHLYPTVTVNGGEAYLGALRLGHGASRQTDSPSYVQHGGTTTIDGAIVLGYQAVHTQGVYRATFLVDGGTISCGDHIYTGNADKTMGADVIITNGGTVVSRGNVTLNFKNTQETNTLVLASGGTIRCQNLYSSSLSYPAVAYFDGGIYQPYTKSGTTPHLYNFQHAYLGAKGLIIDASHEHEYDGTENRWLAIWQTLEPDPALPEGVPDGGLTFTGKGTVATYESTFSAGTFRGGIHVRDGARYMVADVYAAPFAADFAPGTIASTWVATNMIGSLTLGEAGATEPVTLEVRVDLEGVVGLVVSNALSVLSPVAVTTRSGQYDLDCVPRVGTYTALVYSASNADVDLSLFRAPSGTRFTMTARQETIAGGDLDGMKAVVVTFATSANPADGGPVWTSVTSGGAWADSANWNNAAPPSGEGAWVVFNPATKANVPVTLAGDVTVGAFDFEASSAKNGYSLSGGSITLGGRGRTARIINTSGINTVASPITLAGDTSLETMNGNELRIEGGVSEDRDVTVNTHVVTNAGQVNLKVAPGFTGKVTTGSGRVVMDDLSFIQSPDQLTLGLGTLLYTGPDVEIPGFQLKGRSGQGTVFEHNSNVTVNTLTNVGTSAFIKLGTGKLHLNGTGTLTVNTSVANSGATLRSTVYPNGDGPTRALRGFSVSAGTFEMGEVDDPENAPTLVIGNKEIGIGTPTSVKNGSATFVMNNGKITSSAQIYVCYYSTAGNMLTFRQNGGQIVSSGGLGLGYMGNSNMDVDTLFEMNGGTDYFSYFNMGMGKTVTPGLRKCRFVMNGGTLATSGDAAFAFRTTERTNDGFVELNGGLFAVTGTVNFASYAGDYAEARLNTGATWEVGGALTQSAADATGILYGNGGTLCPLGLTAAGQTVSGLTHIYASTNGLVVDTSRFAPDAEFTFAQAIETDPALGGAADGGLVKRGKGVLALSSADHTFTGPARVEGGVLKVDAAAALANTMVELAGGSLVVGSGTATVAGLAGGGTVQGGDLAVTGALAPAANQDGYFYITGALTVADNAVLDVSAFDDGEIAPGNTLFIAAAEGPITAPKTLRVRPAEKLSQPGLMAKTVVEDGYLYVTVTSGGTTIIVR